MKLFLILLFLLTLNCSSNKISVNHGFLSLQEKYEIISINEDNKNDIIKIIGPPSTVSNFDKNKWFYIQRIKTNQSLLKLGKKKIKKNNILIVIFNDRGILKNKRILNINDMNDINYVKNTTEKNFEQNDTLYKIFSSLREKADAPARNRGKNK